MDSFHCALCGKDWPENYCPECARTINRDETPGFPVIDSDIIRGSFSTCAAKIRVNPVRYLWFKDETRLFLKIWLFLSTATFCAAVLRWWIVCGVLLVLTGLLGSLLWWISRRVAEIYYNALLTAGMVVKSEPMEFISVADMGTGYGKNALAVKRVAIRSLPCHSAAAGTQFPCVSGFQDGPTRELWGDFNPEPLSFGTGNRELIQQREQKLGEAAFAQLQRIYREGKYPEKAGELVWLDDTRLERIPPPLRAGRRD